MTKQEALAVIRSGKNGTQLLDLLEKVSSVCNSESESDLDIADVEFDD